MYDGHVIIETLCDKCCHRQGQYSILAESYTDVMKNGCWVGEYTLEKGKKWGEAFRQSS